MHIYVTTLTGKTNTLIVESTDTLASVKERYGDLQGIPPTSQRMVFAGKELDDDSRTLAECSIASESTIHLVLSLRSKPMASDP